jgi:hypothetical protein
VNLLHELFGGKEHVLPREEGGGRKAEGRNVNRDTGGCVDR